MKISTIKKTVAVGALLLGVLGIGTKTASANIFYVYNHIPGITST